MSLFYHILEDTQHLLTEKGFDETSLSSPDKPGWLFQQLRNQLSLALRESLAYNEPADFQLKATGFFNEDKDIVLFNLHFLFDASAGTLAIPQLDMHYNKRTLSLKLQDPSGLPHSSQAVSLFAKPQLLQRPVKAKAPVGKSSASQTINRSKKP